MEVLGVVLTSLLAAATLAVLAKLMGHKQMAQLDFFDYVVGITIGSSAAELATEMETPLRPFIAMAVFGLMAIGLSWLAKKRPRSRKYIDGTPTILMDNGKLYRDNMKKAKMNLSDFMVLCRQAGYFDLSAIQTAVFEFDGRLSILPAAGQRPLTPADMALAPEQTRLFTELIMDGRVLEGNLKRRGLDSAWLAKQLKAQGYDSPGEVFLAQCDDKNALTVYPVA